MALTVSMTAVYVDTDAAVRQVTLVELDHADVPQETTRAAEDVTSKLAKFNPVTVTDDEPVLAELLLAADSVGASKLKNPLPVPAVAATVINTLKLVPYPLLIKHVAEVADSQAVVEH